MGQPHQRDSRLGVQLTWSGPAKLPDQVTGQTECVSG